MAAGWSLLISPCRLQSNPCASSPPRHSYLCLPTSLGAGASTITGLRLTGGPTPAEGRVEVQLAGGSTWGTVEGLVTDTIPSVVCRQLGFGGGAMRGGGMYHAHFLEPHLADEPELPGMLRDVSCSGQEEALSNCSYARERAEMGVIGASLEPLGVACTGEAACGWGG